MTRKEDVTRKERVYLGYNSISLFTIIGSQDRNPNRAGSWIRELMQRPRRVAVYWLALHYLLRLLSYRTQDHQPRDGTTRKGLGPPSSITTKKMPYRLTYSLILLGRFLSWDSFSSDDSSLCQVDIRVSRTCREKDILSGSHKATKLMVEPE